MSFTSRQHLERQWLRLNINKYRLLQIPDCVLHPSIKKRQNYRIERTLQCICSILDTYLTNAFQVKFMLISLI